MVPISMSGALIKRCGADSELQAARLPDLMLERVRPIERSSLERDRCPDEREIKVGLD